VPLSGPLSIIKALPTEAVVGSPYRFGLVARGGYDPYTWSVAGGELPPGLSLSSQGVLSGTPTKSAKATTIVEVRDSADPAQHATAMMKFDVQPPSAPSGPPVLQASGPNWSGYAVTGGPFTSVSGTFDVARMSSDDTTTSTMDQWVGMDGWGNDFIIQAGVQLSPVEGCNANGLRVEAYDPSQPYICAWTMLMEDGHMAWGPFPALTVSSGDDLAVSIEQVQPGTWAIAMADESTTQSWSTQVSYSGPAESAEWVLESPGDWSVPCGETDSAGMQGGCPLPAYNPAVTFNHLTLVPRGSVTQVNEIAIDENGSPVSSPSTVATLGSLLASGFAVTNGG
jgi:hypothetical protein